MDEIKQTKAQSLLEKALKACPDGSTGRLAVLGAGFALLECRAELAGMRAELRMIREAMAKSTTRASAAEARETFGALAGTLPDGISRIVPCRSCKAPMFWAATSSGKKMPLDAKPLESMSGKDSHGVVAFGIRAGVASKAYHGAKYTSHFATCPDADEHRKSKASSSS